MLSTIWALAVLAGMGAMGIAALRRGRSLLGLEPLEIVAFGFPLGVIVASLALLVLAIVFGFTTGIVVAVAVFSALIAAALWPLWPFVPGNIKLGVVAGAKPAPTDVPGTSLLGRLTDLTLGEALTRISLLPTIVIGAFAVRWAFLWDGALTYENGNLFAGQINIWGDWSQHIGDVNSFAYGDNFPPDHPRYAGVSYAYHYLASLTAAGMVKVGMDPVKALSLHSFIFSCCIALGVYAFGRRLTGDRWTAAVGLTLFFLGGGLGWLLVAGDVNSSHDLMQVLRNRPWDNGAQYNANFDWQNIYFSSIEPQRAFLYGLPLCLLVFTILHTAVQPAKRGDWRIFAAAGAVAGLLPFAHLGPLPLLGMVTLALFALFPSRNWVVFGAVWVALTVPQLALQGDGGSSQGFFASFRDQVGWLASPDPWWWWWLKNLGFFIPLLIAGFLDRTLLSPLARRFLWAFMPVFAIANLYVFQPDPWDNTKLLVYWFLAGSIVVGAVLVKAWRANPGPAVRTMVAGIALTLVISGLLVNLQQAEGKDRYLLLTQEELDLAARVREETPTDALFATGTQSNNPIVIMSGRKVVMSYPGWLWPRGIDYGQQEQDLRNVFLLAPNAQELIAKYGIDYVVIGPWERQNFAANPDLWRARYPVVIETPNYLVFRVNG